MELLLEQPEYWPDGIKAWETAFKSHLQTFLKVLVPWSAVYTHRFMYNGKQIFEQYETTTEASLEKEDMVLYVNRWTTVVL